MFKRGSAHRDVRPDKGMPLNNLMWRVRTSSPATATCNRGLDVQLVARDFLVSLYLWLQLQRLAVHLAVHWIG